MEEIQKLAIFDVDGTIAVQGSIPASVIAGCKKIQAAGYTTTISTGRGYYKARESLADNFDVIISANAPMILEHGSKICDRTGKVLFAEYFTKEEIQHVFEFVRVNIEMVRFMWFNRSDAEEKVQIWCYDPKTVAEESVKRGQYAEVFSCPYEELCLHLLEKPLSSISTRLHEFVKVDNLKLKFTRTNTNLLFQDGNMEFVRNTANKASAIRYIEKNFGVTIDNLLTAGNAINDVEMLNMPAKTRVLIGNPTSRATVLPYLVDQHSVITIETPEEFGLYLQNL